MLEFDGRAPWPQDDRSVRPGWSPGDIVGWFLILPVGLLGAAAALLSLDSLLDGTNWSALMGVPLGGWVAWTSIRGAARFVLHLFAPERIEAKAGAALVRLRGDDWLRSEARFESSQLVSVGLSQAQGDQASVWLMHRAGPCLLVATLPTAEARTLLHRLTA